VNRSAKKRHWVTTFLAVWMFADALWLLTWAAYDLYTLWSFYHRPHLWPPPVAPRSQQGFWIAAIFFNFESLLKLFPVPHVLLGMYQIAWFRTAMFRLLGPSWQTSHVLNSSINFAVLGLAIAMGYGLLRMREWARWCYCGFCLLWLWLFFPFVSVLFIFRMVYGLIIPVALLVFLFRNGLADKPARSSSPTTGNRAPVS
jgi:hypothetical protein